MQTQPFSAMTAEAITACEITVTPGRTNSPESFRHQRLRPHLASSNKTLDSLTADTGAG